MARSVDRPTAAVAAVAVLAALGAAGCSTTMQEAARLQLNAARIRTSETPTRVTVAGGIVTIERLAMIRSGGQTAFVVRVRNHSGRAVADLPISVGVRIRRHRLYLNVQSPLVYSYFDAHLPLIGAGNALTWVFTTGRRLPARARPFAAVGPAPSPPAPVTAPLPAIRFSVRSTLGAQATISVRNLTTVPQYQLPVYVFAQRGARYVAAGTVTVPHLGSQATRQVTLGLLGTLDHARLVVEAPPTIPN